MTELSLQRLTDSYEAIAPRLVVVAQGFYARLFAVLPEARPLFRIDISLQSEHLAAALALIVKNLRAMDALEQPLMELGVQHAQVGVRPEHYPVLCRVMVETLRDGSGEAWSPELEGDWREMLERVSRIMMHGALTDAISRAGGEPAGARRNEKSRPSVGPGGFR